MCFYCWKCSPSNPNDPKDAYYSMTICCISKNVLPAIIWLFSIRLIFDIAFTAVFAIFEIPFFIFLTLIVTVALILAVLGFTFKFAWIYYCFGFLTIILLILDLGSLSYIIYSLADGSGWLYDYAHKHISKKSDESLFEISNRNYNATDLILFIFAIFLLLSFLHDLTNLLMINRSIQYLKRFSKNFNRNQRNSNHMDSHRNGFSNQLVNEERYTKRPSDLSIPSIVAPQISHRLSYIEISEEPIRVTTIPYSQPHHHQQHPPERPQALINGGYSFVDPIPLRHSITNAVTDAAVITPGYEKPLHSRANTNDYASLEHAFGHDRIQEQDTRNPFSDPKEKDSKNGKTQSIQPSDAPPIPPKSATLSTKSQNSHSSSSVYKNTVYNNLESHQHTPISPFIPIAFDPAKIQRPSADSFEEFLSADSSFDNEQPSTSRVTEANVLRENHVEINQDHYSNINPGLTQNPRYSSVFSEQSSSIKIAETTVTQGKHRSISANQDTTLYANIEPVNVPQNFSSNVEHSSSIKVAEMSSTSAIHENQMSQNPSHYSNIQPSTDIQQTPSTIKRTDMIYVNEESRQAFASPIQQTYSSINPPLPPPRRRKYESSSSSSDDSFIEHSNPISVNPVEAANKQDDDTLSFTSNDSNDVVTFWSHHPSTRRKRASRDLLNKSGFLTDSSEEDHNEERIPKLLPTNKPPLKNYGLTQILQLEKRDTVAVIEMGEQQERREARSDSLIFALESIKIIEEHEEEKGNINQSHDVKAEVHTERNHGTSNMDYTQYGMHYGHNKSYQTSSSRYENILMKDENLPYQPFVKESNASHSDIMLKRESMSFNSSEIQKIEHSNTPITHFSKITQKSTMTPETPIIPSTSNFFDAWGKATDRNPDETKATVSFATNNIRIEETEEEMVTIANKEESDDSDSTMNFSSSSEENESESDVDVRLEKFKQKLQSHFADKKEVGEKTEIINVIQNEASSSSNNTVTNINSSSNHEEESFKFKRLPLIGSGIGGNNPSTEIFSTPPTTPIYQNPLSNLPQQQPPLPRMPPPTLSHQIARKVSSSSSSSQSLKSINEN